MQQRERRCDNPEPMFGGQGCEQLELGPSTETKACIMRRCPGEIATLHYITLHYWCWSNNVDSNLDNI